MRFLKSAASAFVANCRVKTMTYFLCSSEKHDDFSEKYYLAYPIRKPVSSCNFRMQGLVWKYLRMNEEKPKNLILENHRFLDEAGDTTFYGKGKIPIIGQNCVSYCFILGMVKFKEPLQPIRQRIFDLQNQVDSDPYFQDIPSISKKRTQGGFYFHATDDLPEVRKFFLTI